MTDLSIAAKLLIPRIPLISKTAFAHILGLSEESSKWDLKTALVVNTLRSIMAQSMSSITAQQRFSLKDPGVKGQMWVAHTTLTIDPHEDGVRQLLFEAIYALGYMGLELYDQCKLQSVEAEFQGHRPNVTNDTLPPEGLSDVETFEKLNNDVKTDGTILYFHGGAHYMMDPCTHRVPVSQLCKAAGRCRALNVRYRLAPGHPFPAALLDCLVAYLSLLYPQTGAMHSAVKPDKIAFAGDSAGGNCSMALLALLLHLRRTNDPATPKTFRFNGHDVPLPLPLPAGVATSSAWTDFTRCCPSMTTNAHFDYLPSSPASLTATPAASAPTPAPHLDKPTQTDSDHKLTPEGLPPRKHRRGETVNPFPCDLWPAIPPRADLYTTGENLCHPFVSPLIIEAEHWRGSCPLFFECGEEMLADEVRALARRAASVDVKVQWIGFEAMPHCFNLMFAGTDTARKATAAWGGWIKGAFEGQVTPTSGTWIRAKSLQEEPIDIKMLSGDLTDDKITWLMTRERERRCEVYRNLVDREGRGKSNREARL